MTKGSHIVQAEKERYGTATQTIKVEANSVTSINIILRPTEEKTGKVQEDLTIEQDSGDLLAINKLAGTSVVIDNQPKGSGSLKITGILAGIHELKIGMHKKNIRIIF